MLTFFTLPITDFGYNLLSYGGMCLSLPGSAIKHCRPSRMPFIVNRNSQTLLVQPTMKLHVLYDLSRFMKVWHHENLLYCPPSLPPVPRSLIRALIGRQHFRDYIEPLGQGRAKAVLIDEVFPMFSVELSLLSPGCPLLELVNFINLKLHGENDCCFCDLPKPY